MFIQLGSTYTFLFPTHDATMAAHDADALPTAEVYEDDGDASMYTPTVEQVGALTGLYRVIVEVTAANGFTVGKSYNVIATVVMGGITMNVRVDCFAPEVIAGAGIISVDTPWLVGELPTGGTVTIKLYDSNGASVLLDDDACAEIGVTGFYWWDTGNISVYPAHPGSYLFIMRDAVSGRRYWNTAVIGTPESLDVSAVWDELKVDHVIAGSFGESVAAIQDQTDLMSFTGNDIKATLDGEKVTVSSIDNGIIAAATFAAGAIDATAIANGAIDAATFAANAIDANALATSAVEEIADQVWDETSAGHVGAGSMGKLLADAALGVGNIYVDTQRVDGLIEDDGGGNDRFTAKALEESPGADVASIVDGVWDEAMAAHILPGTTGETLATAGAGGDPAAIADAVWDELLITHLNPGSAGEALETAGSAGITSADLENISTTTAEKVWDEPEKDHRRLNTFGDAIREIRDKCISGEEPSRGGRTKGR